MASQTAENLNDDLPLGSPLLQDGVDPELLELPAPARGRRLFTMGLMALAVTVAIAFAFSLRADVGYFFANSVPVEHGDVMELEPVGLVPGQYVTIEGSPMASYMVTYERLLGGERYAVFPLAGQREIYVQVPLGEGGVERLSERSFSGRLATFGELGSRAATVREALAGLDLPVGRDSFVVLAEEPPASHVWALGLVGLCLLFIVANGWLLLRWFRPLPLAALEDDEEELPEPA